MLLHVTCKSIKWQVNHENEKLACLRNDCFAKKGGLSLDNDVVSFFRVQKQYFDILFIFN